MASPFGDVPWGNLFRWVVSSMFFFLVVGFPIALFTKIDTGPMEAPFEVALIAGSVIIAAIAVWSEDVPWPGDRE